MTQNIFYGGDDYDLSTGDFCPVANGCPQALHRLAHIIDGERRRRGRCAGGRAQHAQAGRPARLARQPAGARDLAVPDPRPAAQPTGSSPTSSRCRAACRRGEHPPAVHAVRPLPGARGLVAPPACWSSSAAAAAGPGAGAARLPRLAAAASRSSSPATSTARRTSTGRQPWPQARPDVPYAVRWPASKALADAGFRDSYRDAHPDPVADPGFTWSPGGPETQKHDFFDRIDWVLHAGPSTTVSSLLVGEQGNPQVDLAFKNPFPTDHRGVVSTFDVTPAPAPLMVSPESRRVIIGVRALRVRFHGTGARDEVVGLVRTGSRRPQPVRGVDRRVDATASSAPDRPPAAPAGTTSCSSTRANASRRRRPRRSGCTRPGTQAAAHDRPAHLPGREPDPGQLDPGAGQQPRLGQPVPLSRQVRRPGRLHDLSLHPDGGRGLVDLRPGRLPGLRLRAGPWRRDATSPGCSPTTATTRSGRLRASGSSGADSTRRRQRACETLDMLKSGTRSAGIAVREK